jgi:hypothetical protein
VCGALTRHCRTPPLCCRRTCEHNPHADEVLLSFCGCSSCRMRSTRVSLRHDDLHNLLLCVCDLRGALHTQTGGAFKWPRCRPGCKLQMQAGCHVCYLSHVSFEVPSVSFVCAGGTQSQRQCHQHSVHSMRTSVLGLHQTMYGWCLQWWCTCGCVASLHIWHISLAQPVHKSSTGWAQLLSKVASIQGCQRGWLKIMSPLFISLSGS